MQFKRSEWQGAHPTYLISDDRWRWLRFWPRPFYHGRRHRFGFDIKKLYAQG